jgi:hypothetical protein
MPGLAGPLAVIPQPGQGVSDLAERNRLVVGGISFRKENLEPVFFERAPGE